MKWYYYLHTNNDLIGKNPIVVNNAPDYFDSPFVKKIWLIDTENRANCWNLAIESLALGAREERIKEIADKWGLTREDLPEFIIRLTKPTELQKNGMDLFISKILNLEPNKVWDEIAAMGNKVEKSLDKTQNIC